MIVVCSCPNAPKQSAPMALDRVCPVRAARRLQSGRNPSADWTHRTKHEAVSCYGDFCHTSTERMDIELVQELGRRSGRNAFVMARFARRYIG